MHCIKSFIFISLVTLNTFDLLGQLNTKLQSKVGYAEILSDVWGWTSSDGIEYALVGLTNGMSIVSIEDPKNPIKVAHVPGAFSYWRDIKTFGNFAYMVADQSGTKDGIVVIDLSGLPNQVSFQKWRPYVVNDTINRCHNLYIDENGYMFLSGCNSNNGGIIIADVNKPNGYPNLLKAGPNIYSHDVYVHEGWMFSSEIYGGKLSVYDFTNLNNIQLVGQTSTPFNFTHNSWATEDGLFIYTTDEKPNAPIAGYHLQDLSQIEQTDIFRPDYSLNSGVIPHNVHVKDDYLFISYYTDGGVIVDAKDPYNLIEVANYDTEPERVNGFHGAWGLYPFFSSGNILISDINRGLYIVKPELKRASRIKGLIRNLDNNLPIFQASIVIENSTTQIESNISGQYKSGVSEPGTYLVTISKQGFTTRQFSVNLLAGEEYVLDTYLTPNASCASGTDQSPPVANCKPFVYFSLENNPSGVLTASLIDSGSYDLCGPISRTLSKTNFNCSDLGLKTITMVVTDGSGNQSQCQSSVYVLNSNNQKCNASVVCDQLPFNLNLSGTVRSNGLLQAKGQIIALNKIESGSQITFKAGQSIILEPGFEVKQGADFSALIEGCTPNIPLIYPKIQREELPGMRTYPNPSNGLATIEFPVSQDYSTELLIVDGLGKKLFHQSFKGDYPGIEMKLIEQHFLKSGTYFISIRARGMTISSSLLVIKE
jgi:choice-of-anchor B domain-containing protein